MASSPISYSPVLRRVRANSRAALRGDDPAQVATGDEKEDSRWRPRSFDSFFQEYDHNQLLEDLRPQLKTSSLGSASASTSSIPTRYRTGKGSEGGSYSDGDMQSSSEGSDLPPRQLNFDSASAELSLQTSSDKHINHSASASLYHAVLSASSAGTPTRLHQSAETSSSVAAPKVEYFPLHKSYSDGGIDVKSQRERRASSPLKILAARNHLETPLRRSSICMEGSGYPGDDDSSAIVDLQDSTSDYDSEKGSDYDSEEDRASRELRSSGGWSPTEKEGFASSPSTVSTLRKRVVWRHSSSPASSTRSAAPSSSSWWKRNSWLVWALIIDAVVLFALGYVYGLQHEPVSLEQFGGLRDDYPLKQAMVEKWKSNAITACQEYNRWLQSRTKDFQDAIRVIENELAEQEAREQLRLPPRLRNSQAGRGRGFGARQRYY